MAKHAFNRILKAPNNSAVSGDMQSVSRLHKPCVDAECVLFETISSSAGIMRLQFAAKGLQP